MRYNYTCGTCQAAAEAIKGSELTTEEMLAEIIFETSHPMFPTDEELAEARKCPRCSGTDTEKTQLGVDIAACFVRGSGYLDKRGCHRDMNLHKLLTDDPYVDMREPGEADDLAERLRRAGQFNPHTQYYPPDQPPGSPAAPPEPPSPAPVNDG